MMWLAPVALATSYHDVWQAAHALRDIIDSGEHEQAKATGLVT